MIKKNQEKEGNNERWLLTYSDLITLLMIFFVIMYASSSIDANKYKQITQSFNVTFGGGKSIIGQDNNPSITEINKPIDNSIIEEDKMEKIKGEIDKYLHDNNIKSGVTTDINERGLVISFKDTLFFDTGKAEVKTDSEKKLIQIGKILNNINNYMRVEGHTDDVPIKNDKFDSNWQLSCIRAANVTTILINKAGIPPKKLSAVGYGQWRPISDNNTEVGKAKNRRVDIVIMNSKFNEIEQNKKQN